MKVGLGLWNHPAAAFALEIGFLFGGMYLYWRRTEAVTRGGCYGMLIFGVVMIAIQAVVFFGEPPTSDRGAAITALVLYFALAGVAFWLEKKRVPQTGHQDVLLCEPAN